MPWPSRAASPSSPSSSSPPADDELAHDHPDLPARRRRARRVARADAARMGRLARDARLARRGRRLGRSRSSASTSRAAALQLGQRHSWFRDLRVSYHVGQYGFSLWLVGLTSICGPPAAPTAWWVGRERPRAYFGAAALPHRRGRRRVLRAGPAALLRVLRGDADPALHPDRGLGRPGPARRDDQVRRLHGRRLAADARRDRRLRPAAGDVRPDADGRRARTTGSSSASRSPSRSRRRSGRSTAGCPTPIASRRPRWPGCSRA